MISGYYQSGLSGWLGKKIAAEAWKLLKTEPHFFKSLPQIGVEGKRKSVNYQVVRKVLGKDIENVPQQIGDCVSFGAAHAVDYLQCSEILQGQREEYKTIFPPYIYGISRVQVGGGHMSGDGSVGAWAAQGVIKYGVLNQDADGCPAYSGSIARQWGNSGPPDKFIQVAKQHPVKSAANVKTWAEVVAAVCNGYPVTVASDQGFEMEAGSDGFHRASGTWQHQMCIIDVDDEYSQPYAIVLNNWGDVHGHLKDFTTGDDLPVGCLRVKKQVIERMIGQGDSFAYSQFDGFPSQPIARELFKLL